MELGIRLQNRVGGLSGSWEITLVRVWQRGCLIIGISDVFVHVHVSWST